MWFQMEKKMNRYAKAMGTLAFVWRLALTTATGSIFGFLVAREAYDSAIMAPLFISMSLALGLAVFNIILLFINRQRNLELSDDLVKRMVRLTGIFVAAVLYFGIVQHLTSLYAAEHDSVQAFFLFNGGIYTSLFWFGQILIGAILPLVVAFWPTEVYSQKRLALVSTLVCIGSFMTLYLIIIGGQAWPLEMFPGMEVTSSFGDGEIATYVPSLPEILLGLGGFAMSALLIIVGLTVLKLLPSTLAVQTSTQSSNA
jgi:molybdopterin-containing oxidoreductase family membrane subunit